MSKKSRPLGWTTLEESKKLLEAGLSPDTADMWYAERNPKKIEGWNLIQNGDAYYYLSLEKPSENNWSIDTINDIPCWSLGDLISLLPEVIHIHNGGNYFLAMNNKSIQYYSKEDHKHEIYFESVITQVLIESVVNLVIYFLEQGYIKKGENNE